MTTHRIAFVCLLGCGLASAALAQAGPPPPNAADLSVLQRMLDAEDARASDSAARAPIFTGLRSPEVATRRTAVRALGRIEKLENVPALQPMVTDSSPSVRAEAINAIGQIAKAAGASPAVVNDEQRRGLTAIQAMLRGLTSSESDPAVRGVLARTLGRLPYETEDVARAASESIASFWMASQPTARSLASPRSESRTAPRRSSAASRTSGARPAYCGSHEYHGCRPSPPGRRHPTRAGRERRT